MTWDDAFSGRFLDLPISADRTDPVVWMDELGRKVYKTRLGTMYSEPLPDKKTERQMPSVGKVVNSLANIPMAIIGGAMNGVSAPGRALLGDNVTYGDVIDTAGIAQLGGAAMPAPKNALRSASIRTAENAPESAARVVARMLRDGRAADITDDLVAMADPQELHRLYTTGATGEVMPMDAASRMARADDMGFSIPISANKFGSGTLKNSEDGVRFHATDTDFRAFDNNFLGRETRRNAANYEEGSFASNLAELGHWTSDRPLSEDLYRDIDMPLLTRGEMQEAGSLDSLDRIINEHGGTGVARTLSDIFRVTDEEMGGVSTVVVDPSNMRSIFARFDPRLSHLANLNAANASPVSGIATVSSDHGRRAEELQRYLDELGL